MNINEVSETIHKQNKEKGFYDEPVEIGTLLMLVVSELSEALEADRKGKYYMAHDMEFDTDNILFPKLFDAFVKDTFEDEIADAVIRLLDLCGYLNIDISSHIRLKVAYNKTRPNKHGKKY